MDYKKQDVELLIATMDRTDFLFLEDMFQKPLAAIEARVLIVNQTKGTDLISKHDHIRVINSNNYGLSNSRNLAIQNSNSELCWILDDDCVILPNAIAKIARAHRIHSESILTFKTRTPSGKAFYPYAKSYHLLDRTTIRPVLSPEITFKKKDIVSAPLTYDTRFGLGAQFEDSENYIFLDDALKNDLKIAFISEFIVQHESTTSSDDAASSRVIYARGALAQRDKKWLASIYQIKYLFFLWRKGWITSFQDFKNKVATFRKGRSDYDKSSKLADQQ